MKHILKRGMVAVLGGVPVAVYAQSVTSATEGGIKTLGSLVKLVNDQIVTGLITLFATAALAAFFFGIVKFIIGLRNGKEADITAGKQFMLWGFVALFVMTSIWGLVKYGQGILGIQNQTNITIPSIGTGGASPTYTTPTYGAPTQPSGTPVGGLPASGSSRGQCDNKPAGTSCTLPGWSGRAQCDISEDGVPGCYAMQEYTCPDGVTKYYNPADSRYCPQTPNN